MRYRPEYAKGEVIVCLRKHFDNEGIAICIADALGYKYLGGDDIQDAYILAVPAGKERQSIRRIRAYKQLVETATLRDLKVSRWAEAGDHLESIAQELVDGLGNPARWEKTLDKLIAEAKKAKELI
jgi:hypothetical protein